jgi:hypothetical protein
VKVKEVASTIAKEHPELLKTGSFKPPTTRCSAWIVVRKPSADNRFYEATVKAPSQVVASWAAHHAKNSWSSNRAHQAALEFTVDWLTQADHEDNVPTIPNRDILGVLEPYVETFMQKGLCRIWCPKCAKDYLQDEIERNTLPVSSSTSPPAKREQWQCGRGHLIYDRQSETVVF